MEKAKKSRYLHEKHVNMSSTIENGLQRQDALPHFSRIFTAFFTEFDSPKMKILNYRIIHLFFKNSEFAAFFDDNLPNLTALQIFVYPVL